MPSPSPLLSPMGTAALQYARAGWPVFPCRERDGEPWRNAKGETVTPKAKAPYVGSGVKDATTDEETVTGWWRRWPDALIGVAMGRNGLFALDFDPRIDEETGEVFTLERLKAELEEMIGEPLPVSLAAKTQSGGVHVYLQQPRDGGEPIRNRGNLPRHVDVRGLGGYVIAPPSVMAETGAAYRWLSGRQGMDPAEAPARLVEILRTKGRVDDKAQAVDRKVDRAPSQGVQVDEAVRKYGLSALDREIEQLRASVPGTRNNNLNAAAYALGQLVGAGAISESVARASLQDVARAWPDFPKSEQTIESGLGAGMGDPRDLSEIRAQAERRNSRFRSGPRLAASASADDQGEPFHPEAPAGRRAVRGEGDVDRRCVHFPLTDLGNAERFRERFGADFRWSVGMGWLGWDGRRWKVLSQDEKSIPAVVLDAVYQTVRAIQDEAELIDNSGLRSEDNPSGLDHFSEKAGKVEWRHQVHAKWGRTSEGTVRLGCIANLARPWLAVEESAFDRDPFAINVLNGTLRFRRERDGAAWKAGWRFTPHDRADLITRLAPVEFDRDAQAPQYDALFAWAQPDAAMRRYLHAWGGLSMTGHMGEQKLQFWYGLGGNGKSTVIDAWCEVIGDYATTVGIETFLDQGVKRRGDQATPDLASLAGVRLLRTSEPEKGAKLATALIKLVTGGEPMKVRFLNRGFFELRPEFKLTISGNFRPDIPDTDDGIWRRVRLIPWDQKIDEANKDPDLPEKLRAERSGILNRLLAGLLDWLQNGLVEPDDVKQATSAYRESSDPLGRFLKLCTKHAPEGRARSSALHEVFVAWCRAAGEREWSQKGFSKAMEDKGFRRKASDGMWWLGLEMVRQVTDFVDHEGKPLPFSGEDEPDPPPRSASSPDPFGGEDDDEPL